MTDLPENPDHNGLAKLLSFGVEAELPELEVFEKPQIDDYRVLGLLGEGGMGQVWRAVQLSTQREVAVKLLTNSTLPARSDKARARFQREVTLAARLNHPNIACVYDSGLHRGQHYYAMELIDGVHLDGYVRKHSLSQRQVLELMSTVCRAVQHAHQQGVIHRDLKPSNILVSSDGQPHVLDFGLAKTVHDAGQPGAAAAGTLTVSLDDQVAGTLAFMSPEQAAGRVDSLDARTDVYSLGVMLYRLVTGQPPHDLSGSQLVVQGRIATENVRRPRSLCRTVDRSLEAILLRALAQPPEGRYAAAGELADDLARYLAGQTVLARPQSPLRIAARWLVNRRLAVAVVVTLLAMLGGIAILGYLLLRNNGSTDFSPSSLFPASSPVPASPRPSVPASSSSGVPAPSPDPAVNLGERVGMKLVRIPAGRFLMGSPETEPGRFSDEGPQRFVTISRPFYLGACQVTRAQFALFVAKMQYRTEAERDGWATIWSPTAAQWQRVDGACWRRPGFEQADDHPVVCVSWNDAVAFCEWAAQQAGRVARLPSEAEWEYGCRAGTTAAYHWGDNPDGGAGFCNGGDQSARKVMPGNEFFSWDDGYVFTSPVDNLKFKPNGWGLHEMPGNVREWCLDGYGPYGRGDVADPRGPADAKARVLRGDSWAGGPSAARSAFRSRRLPDDRTNHIGFRVVIEAE